MSSRRSMLLLAAALFVVAASCSDDEVPAVTVTGPTLTTVPPIGTLPPPRTTPPAGGPTTTSPGPSPTVTAPPLDDPVPGVEHFVPRLPLEDGIISLEIVYVDGTRSQVEWPAALDITSKGFIPYGWAFISGGSSRDFFVRPGSIEDVFDRLGGAELLGEYPTGRGPMIGLWRPQDDDVDYLAFRFGTWSVLVFDYRNDLKMSEEDRALWAANFHGVVTDQGWLVLTTDPPLELVYAGDYPEPLNMTMRGEDGEVILTPGDCEPGVVDAAGDDAWAAWCTEAGTMTIRAYGSRDFQQAILDGLEVTSVDIAEPPPRPEEEGE